MKCQITKNRQDGVVRAAPGVAEAAPGGSRGRDGSQTSLPKIKLHIIASLVALQSGSPSHVNACLVAAGQA